VFELKVAVTIVAAFKVTTQVPVPVHPPPLQPANVELVAADSVSVTCVPLAKLAEHVPGQLTPVGALITVPVPLPASTTVNRNVLPVLNVAVTVAIALNEIVQVGGFVCGLSGVQLLLKPANDDPSPAVAVNVTLVLVGKPAEQVLGQLIPSGLLVTVPVPVPASVTVSVGSTAPFLTWNTYRPSIVEFKSELISPGYPDAVGTSRKAPFTNDPAI
jgi:hypothetical protein